MDKLSTKKLIHFTVGVHMKVLYEKHPDLFNSLKPLSKKYSEDAGVDLQVFGVEHCPSDPAAIPPILKKPISIKSSTQKIFTGIKIFIPKGYFGFITPRSSARNRGIICQSIIDSGYTGWLMPFTTFTQEYIIYPGDKLLQLVIYKIPEVRYEIGCVSSIESERGVRGCGSTGR